MDLGDNIFRLVNGKPGAFNDRFRAGQNTSNVFEVENFLVNPGDEFKEFQIGFSKTQKNRYVLSDKWKLDQAWIQDGQNIWLFVCHCWITRRVPWMRVSFIKRYSEQVSICKF